MIQCNLEDADRYFSLNPRLKLLFDYLRSHNLEEMPYGRIEVKKDEVFINLGENNLISHEQQNLEVHRRYLDVHIPLDKSEIIGWSPIGALKESIEPFNEEKDCALYAQLAQVYVGVCPGQCLIVFPEDAHAPLIGFGTLKKAVCKVLL